MKVRKAVFPVAGLGTRFLPATKVVAKELLSVVDKPLIQYAAEEAFAAGIEEIIFVTGRGKSLLVDHFDHAFELEHTLRARNKDALLAMAKAMVPEFGSVVATRQQEPLGLGHAVWCARQIVGDEPFAVMLPDDLCHGAKPVLQQMTERFAELQSSMVAVMEVPREDTSKYGVLDAGPEQSGVWPVKGMVEKPDPADAPSNLAVIGRYILTPQVFDLLENQKRGAGGEIQLTDAMAALLDTENIYGFRFDGVRYDCGDKVGFQQANLALALERPELREKLIPYMRQLLEAY
ncbi:UTP--glucose-1-phosphate uridylyltransferase GalU [Magnetofaba australis]